MDTESDESLPTVSRAGFPDMLFVNEFNDSHGENEDESANEMPAMEKRNSPVMFDSLDHPGADNVASLNKNAAHLPQHEETDLELVEYGWTLNEEDLVCLPLILNKTRIQEYKTLKIYGQSASQKSSNADKRKKMRDMRLFKKKTGGDTTRLIYMSPLSMIASIAKEKGYDLPAFLETSKVMGVPSFELPCMQCYEKLGEKYLTSFKSWEAGSSNGRCSTCGGQVQTTASFGKMIRQMREVIEAKQLVPYDVYPDGNCLFAAIVDQLRVRGDFSFTTHSLRQSAVNHMRKNPTADDETPLYMFLTDEETWESYLTRMSKDGEWGDHIILRALSNVINMRIVIYGGMSGQRETILYPKDFSRESVKSDAEHDRLDDNSVIYLGHVSESHYMSLRPKQWRQSLLKSLNDRRDTMKSMVPYTSEEHCMITCPMQYMNLILRQLFRMDFIKSSGTEFVDLLVPSRFEAEDYVTELFGSVMCKLVPCKVKTESLGPDISIFFPSVKEDAADGCFQTQTTTIFQTPNDTKIVNSMETTGATDLIAENDAAVVGRVLLIPKKPLLWKGQTMSLKGEQICLKTFEINDDYLHDIFPPKHTESIGDFYKAIGFKSEWPDVAKEWPGRSRENGFPDQRTINTVVELGCHVVPLLPDAKFADVLDDPVHFVTSFDDHNWCYSFVAAEKEICRFISSEQRQCFLVFKVLVDNSLKDIPVPSSVIRSFFFYACEKLDKSYWKSNPGECLLILLKRISECFKSRLVPHYFMPAKNLLEFIPEKTLAECSKRLDYARLQPVVTVYFLLDQMNVMSSEIGSFVEEIIENITFEGQPDAKLGPSDQSLLPAYTEFLQNLIYNQDFHGAMLVLQDVIEEMGGTLMTDGVALIKKLTWEMHIGFQWCFALYVDIKQQTTMTEKLCEGYHTVHVTEVFGPNCIEELPDTLVPNCFSIRKGDLEFPRMVSDILSQIVSNRMYIGCIKFYLKQYADLAGESLVLPDTANDLSHITAGQGKSKSVAVSCGSCPLSPSSNLIVHIILLRNLYIELYNFCFAINKTEEFREMMQLYVPVEERCGSRNSLTNLYNIWTGLGEREKAVVISKRMDVSKGGHFFDAILGDFMRKYDTV